jgi:hypothetical protein
LARSVGLRGSAWPDIAVGQPAAERCDPAFRDVLLEGRLPSALTRLNAGLPPAALEDAYRKLSRAEAPTLVDAMASCIGCWETALRSNIGARTARSLARSRASQKVLEALRK